MTWAFDLDLPPNEKLVLLAIADHVTPEGVCWPSQERIAKRASMSVRTVRTVIQKLEERGLLERSRRMHDEGVGGRATDVYRLVFNGGYRQDLPVGVTGNAEGGYRQAVAGTENPRTQERKTRAKQPETTIPEDWKPTEEHEAMAKSRGLDVEEQALLFRLHAETHDRRAVRWNQAFTTWLMKALPTAKARVSAPRQEQTVAPAPRYPSVDLSDYVEPFFPEPINPFPPCVHCGETKRATESWCPSCRSDPRE